MFMRFETDRRYHAVLLEKDLLQNWCLSVANGGKFNRLGQVTTTPYPTEKDAVDAAAQLAVRWAKRKYQKTLSR